MSFQTCLTLIILPNVECRPFFYPYIEGQWYSKLLLNTNDFCCEDGKKFGDFLIY